MATQFETLHVHTDDVASVKAGLASAANLRKERTWRFRVGCADGWTSLYPELLYDPQEFARTLSKETGRLVLQIAGSDGLLWAIHAAKGGKSLALYRSDKATPSDITALVDAMGPALGGASGAGRDAVADLLASKADRYSASYGKLCGLLGIKNPLGTFSEATKLELVEFQLSQADPGPAPAKPAESPIDYSRQ